MDLPQNKLFLLIKSNVCFIMHFMEKVSDKNSKEKILGAATKLFAQKGFNGVSVREICKKADANICMISYYFGGKQELYNAIIDNLIERQTEFASSFLDLDKHPSEFSKKEQVDLLMHMLDKFSDFFYSKNISKDIITLLLKEQQSESFVLKSPVINYFRKLVAAVFNKDESDKEIIFKTLFIISQVNSSRILPAFSLRLLGQDEFVQEDIKIIKDNVKFYVKSLLKEAGIG